MKVIRLNHRLANGLGSLLDLVDNGWIVKDSAGYLAVTSTKTENQVKSGFLLNVVVREGASVLKLLTSKDETLLIGRDSFLILNLRLDVVNSIRRLHIKSLYE